MKSSPVDSSTLSRMAPFWTYPSSGRPQASDTAAPVELLCGTNFMQNPKMRNSFPKYTLLTKKEQKQSKKPKQQKNPNQNKKSPKQKRDDEKLSMGILPSAGFIEAIAA